MTTSDTDRRIEALAAERVLGLKPFPHDHGFGEAWFISGKPQWIPVSRYLSYIGDAFALLEAHPEWFPGMNRSYLGDKLWEVDIQDAKGWMVPEDTLTCDASLPRAITYACLRAVGAGAELDAILKEAK